jgi:hypothetical protein
MRGVMTVYVQGGVRLSQSAALRLSQYVGKLSPALGHRAEDVIAGAVDNPIHSPLTISGQRFTQRSDYRDTATDAGFEADEAALSRRRLEDCIAMLGKQRLVRRHDVFARFESLQDKTLRGFDAAKKFNNYINIGTLDQSRRVTGNQVRSQPERGVRLETAVGHSRQFQIGTQPCGEHRRVTAQQFDHATADRAAAEQSNPNRLHRDARRRIVGLAQRADCFDAGDRAIMHRVANSAQRLPDSMFILDQAKSHKSIAVGAEADTG